MELREKMAKLFYQYAHCGVPDEYEAEWLMEDECTKQACWAFAKEAEVLIEQIRKGERKRILREIEKEFFAEPQDIPQSGREPVLGCIVQSFWQALQEDK